MVEPYRKIRIYTNDSASEDRRKSIKQMDDEELVLIFLWIYIVYMERSSYRAIRSCDFPISPSSAYSQNVLVLFYS